MASYSDVVKGIRARFVGNAEEHELLQRLQENAFQLEIEVRRKIDDEYKEKLESIARRETLCNALSGDCKIDEALFVWFEHDGMPHDWSFGYLLNAMKGRGLKAEHLELLAEAMKTESVSR